MKHAHAFISLLLAIAIAGAMGLNTAQTAQAQIADQCFDPCMGLGNLSGLLLLPLSLCVNIPLLIIPQSMIASCYNASAGLLLGVLDPVVGICGAIPLLSDLWVMTIVFFFGALDTQKMCALSDTMSVLIASLEMALVGLIP